MGEGRAIAKSSHSSFKGATFLEIHSSYLNIYIYSDKSIYTKLSNFNILRICDNIPPTTDSVVFFPNISISGNKFFSNNAF